MAHQWNSIARDFEKERVALKLPLQSVVEHPLLPPKPKETVVTVSTPISKSATIIDPLSPFDPLSPALDPLSAQLQEISLKPAVKEEEDVLANFTPWSAKKSGILQKYTASGKLSITTSFLSSKDVPKVDKTKARLESLEDDDEDSVQTMLNLSQQDYVKHIDDLHQQLIAAWDADQRVKTLKICIQNAKLLSDTKVPQFYPSKFVLITEILDTFGRLVYDRILRKSTYLEKGSNTPIPLPEKFTPDQVSDVAKETCKNWFFKIASIRELIPRLYVEMAILKCYNFLAVDEYSSALGRLAAMVRGVGNPLVGAYCRAYLCRKGMEVAPHLKTHLLTLFYDFAFTYRQMKPDLVQDFMNEYALSYPQYMDLYAPSIDWILQCVAHQSPKETLQTILDKYTQHCNNALVLESILTSFAPEYVSLNSCDAAVYAQHLLYRTLGVNLVFCAPPKNVQKTIIKEIWKVVSKLEDPKDYVSCAEIYIEIPAKHFTFADVDAMLGDIIAHITPQRAYEKFQQQLQSIVEKILTHVTNFNDLFSMENFMPLLDLFSNNSVKIEVCKSIMQYFARSSDDIPLSDLVQVNGLLYIAKVLHDSINALTFEDEKRQIGELILVFVKRVNYGTDFEQQLNFYVTARGVFSSLDVVLQALVQSVCALVMKTHRIVKGNHTRKSAAFVRAAVGYCYITIPSLVSLWSRLSLYILAAQVALINICLPQVDALFKAAITLMAEIPKLSDSELVGIEPKDREGFFVAYLSNLASTLLVVPGHPEHGPFYLLKGLLNTVQDYKWEGKGEGKMEVYINMLSLFSSLRQKKLPYAVEGVELNDVLYDGDDRYTTELDSIASTLFNEILSYLQATEGDSAASARRGRVALLLFNRICALANLSSNKIRKVASIVLGIAQKSSLTPADQVFLRNSVAMLTSLRLAPIVPTEQGEAFAVLAKEISV